MKNFKNILLVLVVIARLSACVYDSTYYNNPRVSSVVKELKAGTYNYKNDKGLIVIPDFTEDDIPALLNYVDDLTTIPSFPTIYISNSGKIRLGECMLWIIDSIRLGMPTSFGSNMVIANAQNYEAIYFLTDEEVLNVATRYRSWWENRKYPRTAWTIDPCYDDPLCGSGYRWW